MRWPSGGKRARRLRIARSSAHAPMRAAHRARDAARNARTAGRDSGRTRHARAPAPDRDGGSAAPCRRMPADSPAPADPRAPAACASIARCRSPPTSLKITPATRTSAMMPRQPLQQRRRRRADALGAQHQHHRQSRAAPRSPQSSPVRRSASTGRAVEQAHHAFDDQQLRIMRCLPHQMRQRRRPHRPAIEIEARPPGGARMELRIDVVRPHLARRHRNARAASAARAAPA